MLLLKFIISYYTKKCIDKKHLLSTILKLFIVGFVLTIGLIGSLLINIRISDVNYLKNLCLLKLIIIAFPLLMIIFPFNTPYIDYLYRVFPLTDGQKTLTKIVLFVLSWPGLSSLCFLLGFNIGIFAGPISLRIEIFLCLILGFLLVQSVKQTLYYRLKLTPLKFITLITFSIIAFCLIFWPFQNYVIRIALILIVIVSFCALLIFFEQDSYLKTNVSASLTILTYYKPLRTILYNKVFPYYIGVLLIRIISLSFLLFIGNVPFDKINSSFYLLLLMPLYTTGLTIDFWTQYGKFWLIAETISDNPVNVSRKVYLNVVLVNFSFDISIAFIWAFFSHNFHAIYVLFYLINILLTILLGFPLSLLSVKNTNSEIQLNGLASTIVCGIFTYSLLLSVSTKWFFIYAALLILVATIFFLSIPKWYRKRKYTIYLDLLKQIPS